MSTSVQQLMLFRVIQAAGSSAGMSVGSGVIGDIYRLEERGFAMGIYFAVRVQRISRIDMNDGQQACVF